MIRNSSIEDVQRKISTWSTRHYFPTKGHMIVCESRLEKEYVELMQFDRSIQSLKSQAHKLVYYDEGKKSSYTPDFIIERKDGKEIIEVKHSKSLPKHKQKLLDVEIAYSLLGLRFLVLTEEFIRKQPRLANAQLILRYSWEKVSRKSFKALVDHFKDFGTDTIGSVLEKLSPKGVLMGELYKLIFHGIIMLDFDKQIDEDSEISFNPKVEA